MFILLSFIDDKNGYSLKESNEEISRHTYDMPADLLAESIVLSLSYGIVPPLLGEVEAGYAGNFTEFIRCI